MLYDQLHHTTLPVSGHLPEILDKILLDICLETTYQEYLDNLRINFPDTEDAFVRELTIGINGTLNYCRELQSALWTWKLMRPADRMSVINTFYQVFNLPLQSFTTEQKTIIFCKVFLKEFVPLLS